MLGAGSAFLLQLLLARQFGPDNFGEFMAALMIVTMLAPLAGFGISQFWLKAFGKEGWLAVRWLYPSFQFIALSTILVIILILTWAMIGPHGSVTRNLLLILSLYVLGHVAVELVSSKLQLEERYLRFALWQLLPQLARLASIVALYLWLTEWMTGQNVALIFATIAILFTAAASRELVQMNLKQFKLKGHALKPSLEHHQIVIPKIKSIMVQAWPFGLAGLFVFIYMQSDIILVKYITGSEAAGHYSVAFSIMAAVYLLPSVVYQKFFLPRIHRWAVHDKKKFFQLYHQGNRVMLALGLIAMLLIWSLSEWGIIFLFGIQYSKSINILNIIALCTPLFFLASSVGMTLVTQENMKTKVKYMGIVAITNIILNIILIPDFGAEGAAAATVVSNILLLSLYYYGVKKYILPKNIGEGGLNHND